MSFARLLDRSRSENVLNSVLLELTYGCNLHCTFCYNDLKLRGRRVSLEQYKAVLDELAEMGVLWLALSGGEPLLYPQFFELGAHARERGFMVKVKSNAIPLNQRNARRLKSEVDPFLVETSLHGARSETHDRLTRVPGSFEHLLKNIEILKSEGLRVRMNSTLTCWNEGEVEEMAALADRLEVPLQFDPEVTPRDDGDMSPLEIAPSREGIENMVRLTLQRARDAYDPDEAPIRLRPEAAPVPEIDQSKEKVCGAGSTNLVIDPFGNVLPCVQFRRNVGNIHDQSIREIWHGSEKLVEVRDLANQALGVALDSGLKQFCMGVNEMNTGDPLQPPAPKLEIDRIFQRVHWELESEKDPG
jgi:radical SAM protein with 4Fe4S-binding SPASM domain